jgi:hypothetical protein
MRAFISTSGMGTGASATTTNEICPQYVAAIALCGVHVNCTRSVVPG